MNVKQMLMSISLGSRNYKANQTRSLVYNDRYTVFVYRSLAAQVVINPFADNVLSSSIGTWCWYVCVHIAGCLKYLRLSLESTQTRTVFDMYETS